MKNNISIRYILGSVLLLSLSLTSFVMPFHKDMNNVDKMANGDNLETFVADGISYQMLDKENKSLKVVRNDAGDYQGNILIPEEVDVDGQKYTVTCIGSKAFYGGLTSQTYVRVTLPNSITMIEDSAFYSIRATLCNIPENLEYIGYAAFSFCQLPESLEALPETLGYIGGSAFAGCNLSNITTLPSKIKSIEDFTFSQAKIGSLNLGENIISIKSNAFHSSGIKGISLPSGLEFIGDSAFLNCYSLEAFAVDADNRSFAVKDGVLFNKDCTRLIVYPSGRKNDSYVVPDGVVEIGNSAFYENSNLISIAFPNSLRTISDYAFKGIAGVEGLEIPSGVEHIGDGAFMMCGNLRKIRLPEIVKMSDMLFQGCSGLETIDIPSTVKVIGKSVFSMTPIVNIVVPEGVDSIMDFAFSSSDLKSVTLPGSLEYLGFKAFYFCPQLETVLCKAITPPLAVSSFDYPLEDNVVLYVPQGSREQYASAPVWKDFGNIIEGTPSSVGETMNRQIEILVVEGGVRLAGDDVRVTVSDLSGSILCDKWVNGSETIGLARGIYLLNAGGIVHKIMVE